MHRCTAANRRARGESDASYARCHSCQSRVIGNNHDMTYRVIQWATGLVGKEAIKGVLAHPELELIGCWVHSDDKVGRDAGELCDLDPIGVRATNSLDEICALDADAVVYSPVLASTRDVIRLLESGKNVVTPVGWIYPGDSPGVAALHAACLAGNATLHGTGINPGGITERFPLMLSALCRNIRHVRAEEFSDIRNYPTEMVVREVMLFGKEPEVAAKSPMVDVLGHGFMQSIDMVAAELGWQLDADKRLPTRWRSRRAPRHAGRRDRAGYGRGTAVHVGRHRRRGDRDDRAGELVDGRRHLARRGSSGSSASRSHSMPSRPSRARSTACIRRSSASIPRSG